MTVKAVPRKRYSSKTWVLVVVLDLFLIFAALFLMRYVQVLMDRDVRINLTEVVTQNKDVIAGKLRMQLKDLEIHAGRFSARLGSHDQLDGENIEAEFLRYTQERGETSLIWASGDGRALSALGCHTNIAGRRYFRQGMLGVSNISDRIISRFNGEDIFVICVPVVLRGQIVGTLLEQYTPTQMYDLCSVSLFAEKGSSYIINNQGYILISSQQSELTRSTDNYYRILHATDQEASRKLEADLVAGRSGFMEATLGGERIFSVYTPIEEVPDWFLISSIPTTAVFPNGNIVVQLFYMVLLVVTVVFTISTLVYVDQKRQQHLHLQQVAFVDEVTGGDSYTKFVMDLQTILSTHRDKNFCLCTFDIDNFKYINSTYGFERGDKILRGIYEFYRERLLPGERVARVTEDRFVLLLQGVSEGRMWRLVDSEMEVEGVRIYFSAGLYHITDPTENVNLMLDKASTAARKVKGLRYKTVEIYCEADNQEIVRSEQTKRAVEQALADGNIVPFFQPKVDIRTGRMVGAEALARWRTGDGSYIPPGQFIGVSEKTGLIVRVDMAILEQILSFLRHNLEAGLPCVPISVNLSRLHLLDRDFVLNLMEKLEEYGVPPELIELELTETVIFENSKAINTLIQKLHHIGLRISMDDFGTGYSSLHMLKDLEIDVLKIDRTFLLDSVRNERQQAIFGAIVQMAAALQIEVVVEGVETVENIRLMEEFGCHVAQGYYYAKPMDEASFQRLFERALTP